MTTQSAPRASRMQRRLLRHHLPLALIAGLLTIAIGAALAPADAGLILRLTIGSAFVGTGLLAATLLVGPLNLLRARPNPVSTDLRRDIGIWTALVSLAHVLLGFASHLPMMPWEFFFDTGGGIPLRLNAWGQANWLGLFGALIAALLLAISNDRALRALGTGRWKALQRLNYGLIAFVALHALIYIPSEGRGGRFMALLVAILAIVIVGQAAGFMRRRSMAAGRPAQAAAPTQQ
jgi:methionine sulfoxide reductase heme-binding subunit